jgi:hypothetical protein
MNDLGNSIYTFDVITPQTTSGTVNGTGISRFGYETGVFRFSLGKIVGSPDSTTLTCAVQESDDNSSFTSITGASAVVTTTATGKEININFETTAKYIRGTATVGFVGGSGNYVIIGATGVLGGARVKPV